MFLCWLHHYSSHPAFLVPFIFLHFYCTNVLWCLVTSYSSYCSYLYIAFFFISKKKRSSSCGIRTRSRPPQSWRPLRNKPTRSALSDNGCARFWKPQKRTLLTSGRTLTKPAESWRSVTATWNGTPSVPKSQCVRR